MPSATSATRSPRPCDCWPCAASLPSSALQRYTRPPASTAAWPPSSSPGPQSPDSQPRSHPTSWAVY
eukprot:8894843-Lingulodinium_polyedra.AAC.1